MLNTGHYHGWRVYYDYSAPVTGRWSATQNGVSVCSSTQDGLKKLIDLKNSDRLVYREEKR